MGSYMRTVLVVEDSFLESFDLEYRLKELGYRVEIAATLEQAKACFRELDGQLAGIVCDDRLISSEPIAGIFYAYARSRAPAVPFVLYSASPPRELPTDDPFLAVVTKPFMEDVIKHLRHFASVLNKKYLVPIPPDREAA